MAQQNSECYLVLNYHETNKPAAFPGWPLHDILVIQDATFLRNIDKYDKCSLKPKLIDE